MYPIRKIKCNEVNKALALALEAFMQFEAPDREVNQNGQFLFEVK